jgi:hypothetical protein
MTGMSTLPSLGPVAQCTLITAAGQPLVDAYTNHLHQHVLSSGTLEEDTATAIGYPQLAGQNHWLLANRAGRQWLQVVEFPEAVSRKALFTHGWMAMEVLVENVDDLADSLAVSPFELLRPPADLDVSDKIRAFQARGPAGEILYLTQVRGEVPPFDLPSCRAPVDHLFIPVLSTPHRDKSLADYSTISGNEGICFDTRITVLNQARGFAIDRKHPVATLQLAGQALIEIDQIEGTANAPSGVSAGVASVAFYCSGTPPDNAIPIVSGPFAGHHAQPMTGSAGERFTMIYP